jgi:hypothetical protein
MPVASSQGFKELTMSDKHELSDKRLRHICWGMCTLCVLALAICVGYIAWRLPHSVDYDWGMVGLGGVLALIGFYVFFSIAHDESVLDKFR